MNTCPRCNDTLHRDFPDKVERCSGCDRTAAWCRCQPVKAERTPLWIARSRESRRGLARDMSGVAA